MLLHFDVSALSDLLLGNNGRILFTFIARLRPASQKNESTHARTEFVSFWCLNSCCTTSRFDLR